MFETANTLPTGIVEAMQQYNRTLEANMRRAQTERFRDLQQNQPKVNRNKPIRLTALGTHTFTTTDTTLHLGETGLTLKVTDLHLNKSTRKAASHLRQPYTLPSFLEAAHATITGTENKDIIHLHQNEEGNTLLNVRQGGKEAEFDLGRIAAVTLQAGGGNDHITLTAQNYVGGIQIQGEAGNDVIAVNAMTTLHAGVTLQGGEGNDVLSVSGKDGMLNLSGDAGADQLYAGLFSGLSSLQRTLAGGADNDLLMGSLLGDQLYGNAGDDIIHATAGNNTLYGGDGNDILYATPSGNDILYGEAGSDTLAAQNGIMQGGAGNDFLYGTTDSTFLGGSGTDNFILGGLSPHNLYATGSNNTLLQLQYKGTTRHQPLIADSALNAYQTNLGDYAANQDYLVDINLMA